MVVENHPEIVVFGYGDSLRELRLAERAIVGAVSMRTTWVKVDPYYVHVLLLHGVDYFLRIGSVPVDVDTNVAGNIGNVGLCYFIKPYTTPTNKFSRRLYCRWEDDGKHASRRRVVGC